MELPEGFLFSQSNLQDYIECQRRFQLRYLLHQAWPAVEVEPYLEYERRMDQGAKFHKIIRQFLIGVTEDKIWHSIMTDEVMKQWWTDFIKTIRGGDLKFILDKGNLHFEEISLTAPIGKFRLIAKYDLLIVQKDSRLIIFDWKTSQNLPKRRWLAERMQTHVYPFVLVEAATSLLNRERIDPGQIEMVYWFANHPEQIVRFGYNEKSYLEDSRFFNNLVTTISHKIETAYPLTPDIKRCLFCTYRSLCNRGVTPGDLQHLEGEPDADQDLELSLDFDQIGEIEY